MPQDMQHAYERAFESRKRQREEEGEEADMSVEVGRGEVSHVSSLPGMASGMDQVREADGRHDDYVHPDYDDFGMAMDDWQQPEQQAPAEDSGVGVGIGDISLPSIADEQEQRRISTTAKIRSVPMAQTLQKTFAEQAQEEPVRYKLAIQSVVS